MQKSSIYGLKTVLHVHVPGVEHFHYPRQFSHVPFQSEAAILTYCFDLSHCQFVLPILELCVNGLITVCALLCRASFAQHNFVVVICSSSKLLVLSVIFLLLSSIVWLSFSYYF